MRMPALERFLVQGSSRSWKGAPDPSVSELDGRLVVEWTLERIARTLPGVPITLVAPAFDRGGRFEDLPARLPQIALEVLCEHDDDPLARLVAATRGLADDALVARCDAQHCFFDVERTREMAATAARRALSCVKFPDDFPPQFASEIYRVGALRRLADELDDAALRVHPKLALCRPTSPHPWALLDPPPRYADAELRRCRERARAVYGPRSEGDARRRLRAGDQSRFHYELAAPHLAGRRRLLEAACGDGSGARFLADRVPHVTAVDCDAAQLPRLSGERGAAGTIEPVAADVTRLPFPDGCFDAATSFETIEHTDPEAFLRELRRVLAPGAVLVLSTPQNSLGRIPLNPHHEREFSLDEIRALCEVPFRVREVTGIKAGRVVVPGDPVGNNTVLVCERP